MALLDGKNVVLGVTGGIAAYKAAELCRLLKKAGADVHVILTAAGAEFITPLTLQTLSGNKVAHHLFDLSDESEIGHIKLADQADVVVVAPATADLVARFAAGMANDLLTTVLLATRAPVLLAPAMNVNMWEHPLTQANLNRLLQTGRVHSVGPDAGDLACGWVGAGRLVEPSEVVQAAEGLLARQPVPSAPLAGRQVVVTAGPTFEPIDDVRFLGNRSSGKMGFAMAAQAAALGAQVTLVAGPVSLPTPAGVTRRVNVESTADMQSALAECVGRADVLVMAAAVSDFRPAERARGKLSRQGGLDRLPLVANPDLLRDWGSMRTGSRPLLVGFAAEVSPLDLVARARAKLAAKGCDVIVANDVGEPGLGFGSDRNAVTLVFRDGRVVAMAAMSKMDLAAAVWPHLWPLLAPAVYRPDAAAAGVPGAS